MHFQSAAIELFVSIVLLNTNARYQNGSTSQHIFYSVDKQESLKYVRSHCCGVVLEGQFHLLGGATKVPGERSDNVASDFHQVCIH